jgi:hypothetical protein
VSTTNILALARQALAAAEKATPGPWTVDLRESKSPWSPTTPDAASQDADVWGIDGPGEEGHHAIAKSDSGVSPPKLPDALFIASARTSLPILATWVARVAPAIDRLHEARTTDDVDEWDAIDALIAAAALEVAR